jgi:hypothetical protein
VTIRPLRALLVAVLLAATACHRTAKTEQLAALDSAYQSGLLTKDEYDAKKIALIGTSPAPVAALTPVSPVVPAAAPAPAAVPNSAPPPLPPKEVSPAVPALPAKAAASAASSTPSSSPNVPRVAPSEIPRSKTIPKEPEPAPLAGCEDAEYKSGGQKGAQERFFAATPEAVRRAAVSALDSLDFNIHKNSNNEIEASKKRHIGVVVGAGGERVILTLRKAESGGRSGTRVIGETKKNFVGHVTQRTWTDAVLAQIGCKLSESSR